MKRRNGETENGSNGVREYRSKGVKENYPDTPIRRYTDTEIHRFPDSPIRYKAGFSLIEIMVVVVIIGIMLSVAIPRFISHQNRTSVKLAARSVASTMRLANSKATTLRTDHLAVFDLDNETIWVQDATTTPVTGDSTTWKPVFGTEKKLPKTVVIVRVKGGSSTGTGDPGTGDEDTGIGYHTFFPKGTATSGSVFLKDKDQKVFYRVVVVTTSGGAKINDNWD